MKLGTLLREFRHFSFISSAEMHELTGFSMSYIYAIENTRKSISTRVLEEYAKACKVKVSQILKIQEDSEEFHWDDRTIKIKIVQTLYPSD